jgi:hypothetical protein
VEDVELEGINSVLDDNQFKATNQLNQQIRDSLTCELSSSSCNWNFHLIDIAKVTKYTFRIQTRNALRVDGIVAGKRTVLRSIAGLAPSRALSLSTVLAEMVLSFILIQNRQYVGRALDYRRLTQLDL